MANPVNCLEIGIPDVVMTECSRIENGHEMKLFGKWVKRGSSKASRNKDVTIFASRRDTSLVFSLHSSSMGNIFQKKLSGIWSCQIHATSTCPRSSHLERNDDEEDDAVDSVSVTEISHIFLDSERVKQEFDRAVEVYTNDRSFSQEECVPPNRIVSIVKEEIDDHENAESFGDFCELPDTKDSSERADLIDGESAISEECGTVEMEKEAVGSETESSSDENFASQESVKARRKRVKKKPYACTKCSKTFITKYLLDRHEAVHDPDKGMQCPFCQRQYQLKYQLDVHIKTHTREPSNLACNICDKKFKRKISLEIHRRQHTGENPYTCETCGQGFRSSTGLANHRWHHADEKPYKCELCQKAFVKKKALDTHIRTHTGEKPYMCTICGKTFGCGSSFSIHRRVHSEEKPYQCSVCGKGFKIRAQLLNHSTIHNAEKSFFCEICGMGFWQKDNLRKHKVVHNEKKNHKCSTCGREFRTTEHLKVHIRQHTGEKPYACDLCDKRFRQNVLIRRHKRLHHPTTTS